MTTAALKMPAPAPVRALSGERTEAGELLTRILLTRVCDLDALCGEPQVRDTIARFAASYILVALPKSSSTYCTKALSAILGAAIYKDIVTQDLYTPKDLSVPAIVAARDRATISQVHLVASGANLRIIRNFGLPVVILLRNLFDAVISLRDHMAVNPFFSSILIPSDYKALSEADKLDYIIDTAVPWMITFYTSWAQAITRGDVATTFFHYEDMVQEPEPFFMRMCARLGAPVRTEQVAASVATVEKTPETRFNIGVPGRGLAELSAAQVARIKGHARYYPNIDFTPIGL